MSPWGSLFSRDGFLFEGRPSFFLVGGFVCGVKGVCSKGLIDYLITIATQKLQRHATYVVASSRAAARVSSASPKKSSSGCDGVWCFDWAVIFRSSHSS